MKDRNTKLTPIRHIEKNRGLLNLSRQNTSYIKEIDNILPMSSTVNKANATGQNIYSIKTYISKLEKTKIHKRSVSIAFVLIFLCSITASFLTYMNGAQALVAGDGKLIYGEGVVTTPRYRDWTTSNNSFSGENSAATAAATIRHTAVEASSTRNEMISAVSTTAGGVLYVQRWNGTNWSAEWNATVGDSVLPRFDVAYEQSSGDAIVVYSGNAGTTNELRYRVWNGSSWTAEQNLDPARTSGTVDAVILKSRTGTNNIGLAWGDTSADLSANFWDGDNNTWQGEHSAALSTNLSRIGAGTTLTSYSFDLAFESTSGELVVGWGTEGVSDPSFMKRTAGAGGAWSGSTVTASAAVEEVTDFEMSSDPYSNYIGWVNITSESTATPASPDLESGMWDGSTDTIPTRFNGDTATGIIAAGTKNVSGGWVRSGTQDRYVTVLDDASVGAVNWQTYDKNGNTWSSQTDFTTAPQPTGQHTMELIKMNPYDSTELMYIVADANGDLFTKGLSFDGTNYNWSALEPSSTSPEISLSSSAGMVADFAYNITLSELEQTAYRWYTNDNTSGVGAVLANLNTAATAPAEGTPFRLRMLIKVLNAGIAQNEISLKLQYAERGVDNSCDVSFTNETYQDVDTDTGDIRFYNNSTPDDEDAITSSVDDPTNSSDTVVDQSYQEENNFTNSETALATNENGNWDFSLVDYSASAQTVYCFRAVTSSGAVISDYSQIPQITTAQPAISSIAIDEGPTAAGMPFTITGSKFEAGATVSIGGVAATNVFTHDASTITGITGAGTAGAKNVVVTNPSATSATLTSGFTHSTTIDLSSKSLATAFTAGTTSNLITNGLKIDENLLLWNNLTASASGGSMATATYYYVVTAIDINGNETGKSVETAGISVTGPTGSVALEWQPIQGAYGYKLYRTTSSGSYITPALITTISTSSSSTINNTISYTDTALSASSGAPPASNNTTAGVSFSMGTVPSSGNGTFSAGPATPSSIRWGSHSLKRPDGMFLVIRGGEPSQYLYL